MPDVYKMDESVEYFTPLNILDACRKVHGDFDLDPASCAEANTRVRAKTYFTEADDGLAKSWGNARHIFLNPPYNRAGLQWEFAQKAVSHARAKQGAVWILVRAATDTAGFLPLWRADALCFIRGRLKFYDARTGEENSPARFPNALAYFGPSGRRAANVVRELGSVVRAI